jgi:lipopolysaccharide export system permease protein
MTILDRYFLRSFIFNLFMWLFCFIGIFVVFDLVSNFDDLLKVGKETGGVVKFFLTYYMFKSIPIVMMLGSLLALLSTMVTVAMVMRLNELVPIQAAGISTFRIVMPLLIAFLVVVGVLSIVREFALPRFLDELTADFVGAAREKGRVINATVDYETGILFNGNRLFQKEKRILEPIITINKPITKRAVTLKAVSAVYLDAQEDRPAGFMLSTVWNLKELPDGASMTFENRQIVFMTKDAPEWIKPTDCFVATKIPYAYFASSEAWSQYASTWEMIAAARNPSMDLGQRILGTIHARILMPILDAAVIFLGLPIILTRGDRNVFKAMGVCSLIIISFLIVREGGQYLGTMIEQPAFGAWLPLMLFGPIAVRQFQLLRTQ